ncbi:MAG TPA: hypothetical protein VL576_02270 [Candidatus Paceibacterota bacterium]|jgi:hypothetical protein|nr:hypothetical protein [Candidatus Paceibacterota bacterium]
MKKFGFKSLLATVGGVLVAVLFTVQASAMIPTLSLSNNGFGTMQVSVYGDANAPIILDYYSGGQLLGAGIIGYTNYSGYYSGTLNQSTYYSIPNGAQVLIYVNGQQSNTVTWQGNGSSYNNGYPYNNYGTMTFSQSNVNLTVGQSQTIYINGTYNNGYSNQYYVSSNLSNGVVSATLSGNALTLYGQNNGSANITVCSGTGNYYNSNSGCGTVYVTVSGYNYNNNYYNQYPYNYYNNYNYNYGYNTLSVSNNNVQVTTGNSATVTVYGNSNNYYNGYYNNGNYYISNTGSGIAYATINGSTVTIYGQSAGTSTITVCQTGGGCATINVTVTSPYIYNGGYNYPYNNGNWYWSPTYNCWMQR